MSDIHVLTFEGGGSGRGISYYTATMECPRKARLNEERRERMAVADHNYSAMFRADVGTVFHKLAEIYHTGQDATVELADPAGEPALAEGQRLFSAYSARFRPDFWGEVLGAELHLPGVHSESCPAANGPEISCECGNAKRSRQLLDLFGVEFTGRVDLVVRVSEEKARSIESKTGLGLGPGVYLLDHKTKARKDSNMATVMQNSLQFWAYMLAYNELNPDEPCKGMIANIVVAHKKLEDKSFSQLLCPLPDGDQEHVLGTFLRNGEVMAKTDMPNAAVCFNRGICSHFESGRCGRG